MGSNLSNAVGWGSGQACTDVSVESPNENVKELRIAIWEKMRMGFKFLMEMKKEWKSELNH